MVRLVLVSKENEKGSRTYACSYPAGGPAMWSEPLDTEALQCTSQLSHTRCTQAACARAAKRRLQASECRAGDSRPGPHAPGGRAPQVAELGRELLAHGRQERADGVALAHGRVPPVARAVPVRVRDLQRLIPQQLRAGRNCLHTLSITYYPVSMLGGASSRTVSAVGCYELARLSAQPSTSLFTANYTRDRPGDKSCHPLGAGRAAGQRACVTLSAAAKTSLKGTLSGAAAHGAA